MNVDTIVAVSTAPGPGAIAVVRVSGPDAGAVLLRVAGGRSSMPEPRRATLVQLVDPEGGSRLDRAIVTWFPGPASYTGEDLVEVSCHGGWLIPELVCDAFERAGARRAEPGEFTRRAYLRGKLDLIQAEAVAELVAARSRALHRAALSQLERGLSHRLSDLRGRIVDLEALLVHHIDFPEEDDPPVPVERIVEEAGSLVASLDAMLATAPEGELLREGALTVFAGLPNVGKSSLYNALLGQERAIVTDVPGTTRDALEATVELGGFPFRLVDTAGLRTDAEHIERMGIEVARRYLDRADVVLFCVASDEPVSEADADFVSSIPSGTPVVIVETKADRREAEAVGLDPRVSLGEARDDARKVRTSAVSGQGLDRLRQLLPELVYSSVVAASPEVPVVTQRRHARGLRTARDEVERFRAGLLEELPVEVAAAHLRVAETALEELLGILSTEDVLDVVFREFCVGK